METTLLVAWAIRVSKDFQLGGVMKKKTIHTARAAAAYQQYVVTRGERQMNLRQRGRRGGTWCKRKL